MSQSLSRAEITETPILRFAGHNFEPLPSGGLFWHAQKTLLVARVGDEFRIRDGYGEALTKLLNETERGDYR